MKSEETLINMEVAEDTNATAPTQRLFANTKIPTSSRGQERPLGIKESGTSS